MNRMVVQSRVGSDGVLHLSIPIGEEDADREVQITIDPTPGGRPNDDARRMVVRSGE